MCTPGALNTGLRLNPGNLGNAVIGVARNPSNGEDENLPKRLNRPPVTPKPSKPPNPGKLLHEYDHGIS